MLFGIAVIANLMAACFGTLPQKRYFEMSYIPISNQERLQTNPYTCTIQVGIFEVEAIYNRPEIVYRQSPLGAVLLLPGVGGTAVEDGKRSCV